MAKKKFYDGNLATTNDMANMPQDVKITKIPEAPYASYDVNDGISGIDSQMKGDMVKRKPSKPGAKS